MKMRIFTLPNLINTAEVALFYKNIDARMTLDRE